MGWLSRIISKIGSDQSSPRLPFMIEIRPFSKHTILTGAGWAKNWGGSSTFSSAESTGIRLNDWKMKPMWAVRHLARARSLMARKFSFGTRMSPLVARSMAAMRWSSVVLPLPDGPINATKSPL